MAELKLFEIGEQVKERPSSEVLLERELQNLIENNMELFFGVRFLKSEYTITNGRMDSIGIDENNSPVIFEYKRSQNENVINQGLFYLDWLLDHRKAIKLTSLIPELADILENNPKQLNLACADLMADYDAESQKAFIEMCSVEGLPISKSIMQHIVRKCPPPTAGQQEMYAAWREARDTAVNRLTAPPKKISFNRKQFAPYLDKLGSDQEIEKLFLEFLRERVG